VKLPGRFRPLPTNVVSVEFAPPSEDKVPARLLN